MALSEQSSETAEQSMDSVEGSVSSEDSTGRSMLQQLVFLTVDQVPSDSPSSVLSIRLWKTEIVCSCGESGLCIHGLKFCDGYSPQSACYYIEQIRGCHLIIIVMQAMQAILDVAHCEDPEGTVISFNGWADTVHCNLLLL